MFQKHLNLTLLFVMIIGNVLAYWGTQMPGDSNWGFVPIIIAIVLVIGTEIWYLHQKGQSMLHLFGNLLAWIGFIVILFLNNKQQSSGAKPNNTLTPPAI